MERDHRTHQGWVNHPDNKARATWAVTNNGTGSSTPWRNKTDTQQNNRKCTNDQCCMGSICVARLVCHTDTGSDRSDNDNTDSDADPHHNSDPRSANGHHHPGPHNTTKMMTTTTTTQILVAAWVWPAHTITPPPTGGPSDLLLQPVLPYERPS